MNQVNNLNLNRRIREINELEKILEKNRQKIIREKLRLQNKGSHTIAINVSNKKTHKIGPINTYICPICDKIGHTYPSQDIAKTPFYNSKIIDLTEINYEEYENFFTMVKEEIIANYEYYYDQTKPAKELSD